jgi:glyoxylase-like metal-dependent hydrolase (beta-lactamase superfamily II)
MNKRIDDDWQALPGATEARIQGLLMPPNIVSSNTAVIVPPEDQALVVGPGGTPERAGEIEALLRQALGQAQEAAYPSPMMALLTHAHFDHLAALAHLHRPVLLHGHAQAHLPRRSRHTRNGPLSRVTRGFPK